MGGLSAHVVDQLFHVKHSVLALDGGSIVSRETIRRSAAGLMDRVTGDGYNRRATRALLEKASIAFPQLCLLSNVASQYTATRTWSRP
jgi:hypothetical protein